MDFVGRMHSRLSIQYHVRNRAFSDNGTWSMSHHFASSFRGVGDHFTVVVIAATFYLCIWRLETTVIMAPLTWALQLPCRHLWPLQLAGVGSLSASHHVSAPPSIRLGFGADNLPAIFRLDFYLPGRPPLSPCVDFPK